MKDSFGRSIEYLRISLTDACNLSCIYCRPAGYTPLSASQKLNAEEIIKIVQAGAKLGIKKIKLTGGEPLLFDGLETMICKIKQIEGIEEVTLTSNGILLKEKIPGLRKAGLDGINLSLDTLDRDEYKRLTGTDGLNDVLEALALAVQEDFSVKINTVLLNDDKNFWSMIHLAEKLPVPIRFIEMMPIGEGRKFRAVKNESLLSKLLEKYPNACRETRRLGNGPAQYWKIPGFQGQVGFISPVHHSFCSTCSRIRLTCSGQLKCCLYSSRNIDLRPILCEGSQEDLKKAIEQAVRMKPERHSFFQEKDEQDRNAMIQIGG